MCKILISASLSIMIPQGEGFSFGYALFQNFEFDFDHYLHD